MAMPFDLQRAWHDFIVAEAGLAGLDTNDRAAVELFADVITPALFTAWVEHLSVDNQHRVCEAMVADGVALRFSGRLQ